MGEHLDGRQLVIPSGHRRYRLGVARQVHMGSALAAQRMTKRQRETRVRRQLEKLPDLPVPSDGIIRATSNAMAKKPPKHAAFKDFRALVRVYCGLALGYSNRYVVQTYLYVRLNQLVSEQKAAFRTAAEALVRTRVTHPQRLELELQRLRKPIERSDLERMAHEVFKAIQLELLDKVNLRHGGDHTTTRPQYNARRVTIGLGASRTGFLIIDMSKGKLKVLALKTDAEFKARQQRGTKPKQEYRNSHQRKVPKAATPTRTLHLEDLCGKPLSARSIARGGVFQ